jgi:hypothetical protein
MVKRSKDDEQLGTLYFDNEDLAKAHWRKMAAACRAAKNGTSADLEKKGKGWVVTVYAPKTKK